MSPTKTAKAARHRCRMPWERRFHSARLTRLDLHLLHLPLTPPSLHLPHFLRIPRILLVLSFLCLRLAPRLLPILHLLHLPLIGLILLVLRIPPAPQLLLTLPLRRYSRSRRLLLPLRSLLRSLQRFLQCRKSLISL